MDDLRSEIRAAFQKEQALNPSSPDLRHNIVQSVATRPGRRVDLQWMAVAAAIVIGALVVVSLMSTRIAQQSVPVHRAPVGDYGPPPAGVPLFYLQDPLHDGWYIGFDWSGKPRGTIKLANALGDNGTLNQAPDGSAFGVAPLGKGRVEQFLDRLGNPTTGDSLHPPYYFQMWADDSTGLCALDYDSQAQQWQIGLRAPGAPATVRPVAIHPNVATGIIAIDFRACSPRNDRAILVYNLMGVPTELWVVRISDGAILLHRSYPANNVADITASPDGSLIAESSGKSVGYIGGPTAETTVVERLSDGARLMKVDPGIGVLGFSADMKTVLVSTSPWSAGRATNLAILDIRTGQPIWSYNGGELLSGFFIDPAGSGFAVMLQSVAPHGSHPPVDVVVVDGAGKATDLTGNYLHP